MNNTDVLRTINVITENLMTKNRMNERIKQLATEVGISVEYLTNTKQLVLIEKFAELIVRECIAICQDIDGEDNIDARSGRQDCAVEIKEHFGVEE